MKIPELRKIGKNILKEAGYLYPSQDGKGFYMYKGLGEKSISIEFSLTSLPEGIGLTGTSSFHSQRVVEAYSKIDGSKKTAWSARKGNYYRWNETVVSNENDFIIIIKNEIAQTDKEAQEFDPMSCEDQLLETLNRPGAHQAWYLSVLSARKEVQELKELLNKISADDRGGLLPYIDEQFITKAITYAEGDL